MFQTTSSLLKNILMFLETGTGAWGVFTFFWGTSLFLTFALVFFQLWGWMTVALPFLRLHPHCLQHSNKDETVADICIIAPLCLSLQLIYVTVDTLCPFSHLLLTFCLLRRCQGQKWPLSRFVNGFPGTWSSVHLESYTSRIERNPLSVT